MTKYKTLLIAAAAALLAVSPAAASGAKPVDLEIGTYSIDTARSEASITRLLAKQGFSNDFTGSNRVVGGVEKASDALSLLRGLNAPSEVSSASLHTKSGTAVPFSVGQTVDYVKGVDVTTDDKGKKRVTRHLGEADSGISVSLAPKVGKGGVVDVKVKSELTHIQFKDFGVGNERIQLLDRQTYSLNKKARLNADQAAVYVRYVPAEKPTLFKAGEVLVTVVKAKVAK
jgi:type II secretory pathway component GspD/PulD (secretin)